MSIPYLPLYVTDYEGDTAHLSLEEDGAYNRLMRLMWRTPGCRVPDDDKWIARKMRVDMDTFLGIVAPLIDEFLCRKNGFVFSRRLQAEYKKVSATSKRRSAAGKKGGRPQAIEIQQKEAKPGLSRDKAGPKHPEPEPDIVKREAKASPKKGTRLREDWTLPSDWGAWALGEGYPDAMVRQEAAKFRDYWISKSGQMAVKRDWQATWRNWMRNSNSPKIINGGQNEPASTNDARTLAARLRAPS